MNEKQHLIDIRTHRILKNMARKPMEMVVSKSEAPGSIQLLEDPTNSRYFFSSFFDYTEKKRHV